MSVAEDFQKALSGAIASRRLKGITLWPTENGQWQGNARWNDKTGWTIEVDDDPVVALAAALTKPPNFEPAGRTAPKRRQRSDDDLI